MHFTLLVHSFAVYTVGAPISNLHCWCTH